MRFTEWDEFEADVEGFVRCAWIEDNCITIRGEPAAVLRSTERLNKCISKVRSRCREMGFDMEHLECMSATEC